MPLTHLLQWAEFMALGLNEPDGPLDAIISSQKPNQCCTLIYTSGTTGQPKGVMLSHDNVSGYTIKSPLPAQQNNLSFG